MKRNHSIALTALVAAICLSVAGSAHAYVDLAPTLAKIINDSRKISLVEVTDFNPQTHIITLREINSIKGDSTPETIQHDVTTADGAIVPRQILQWAAPGARAVMFGSRTTALVCIGEGWYQVRGTGSTPMKLGADRPDLPLAYYGSLSRLVDGTKEMLAGKDAIITVVAFGADQEGASFDLALNRQALPGLARVQRIRANLKMPQMVAGASSNPNYFIGLGAVDEAEVPLLIEKLKSGDAMARAEAAEDLRTVGKPALAAEAPLTALLSDAAPHVRLAAASALLKINQKNEAPLEVLKQGLSSSNPDERRLAAHATGMAGKAAGKLSETLGALLKDADDGVRINALQAISLLGKSAAAAADAVAPLLDQPDVAIDAADALGRIGPAAQQHVKRLAQMLKSDKPTYQWAAVRAMAQIGGPDAKPAVDYMINALPKATEVEGYNMMVYFTLLGPVAADAMPTIRNTPIKNPVLPSAVQWTMAPTQYFPWQAGFGGRGGRGGGRGPGGGMGDIGTLIYQDLVRELGERLAPASPVLARKIMDGSAGDVPAWGYDILSADPNASLGVLTPFLRNDDANLRERAVVAIGNMKSNASAAKPQLEQALRQASGDAEKRLIRWAMRQMEIEQG
jgi:HEAT repeat protein